MEKVAPDFSRDKAPSPRAGLTCFPRLPRAGCAHDTLVAGVQSPEDLAHARIYKTSIEMEIISSGAAKGRLTLPLWEGGVELTLRPSQSCLIGGPQRRRRC